MKSLGEIILENALATALARGLNPVSFVAERSAFDQAYVGRYLEAEDLKRLRDNGLWDAFLALIQKEAVKRVDTIRKAIDLRRQDGYYAGEKYCPPLDVHEPKDSAELAEERYPEAANPYDPFCGDDWDE